MKRTLIFILTIAMALILAVPAFAGAAPTVAVTAVTEACAGETVRVAVTIADNPGLDVLKLKFSYDTSALTLKSIENGSVMTGAFTPNVAKAVALLEAAGTTNATGNGTLVTLTFEVSGSAAVGDYEVGFLVANGVNRAEEKVPLDTNVGVIRIKAADVKISAPMAVGGLVYSGTEQTGVADGAGYTLTGHKATDAGSYTATARLKSGYVWSDGTKTDRQIGWKIARTSVTPEIVITGTYTYLGTAIVPTYTVKVDGAVLDAGEYTVAVTDNINAGSGKITVTDKAGGNYAVSMKTENFTIGRAAPTYSVPTGLVGSDGKALSTVSLPSGWSWMDGTTIMNATGAQEFKAVFTPADTANYESVANIAVTVTVSEHTHADENKDHNCDICDKKLTDHTGGTATCKDKATCTICSQQYGEFAEHKYKTEWSKDSSKHWHECSVCGDRKDEAAHTPGAVATETKPQVCTVCNYEITPATGHMHSFNRKSTDAKYLKSAATCTKKAVYYYSCSCGATGTTTFESGDLAAHTYKTEWSKNNAKHWHECSVCGNKKDEAAHTPGAAATETTPQTCTACGYVIQEATGHVHSYTEKNTDAKHLESAATCTAKAVYYYSCSCGEKGTETFESGETLAHTWETKWVNNDSKHWHECTVCKTKGDEADHAFEWKIDKEATVAEAGAKHEECKDCGYRKTAVAIDKLAPDMIGGKDAKWSKGGEAGLEFSSNAAFSDFIKVLVDDQPVDPENYDIREGSIIIQLKASYLATLAEGEHTLTIRSTSGDASAKFTVEAKQVSPVMGSTSVLGWIIVGVVTLGVGAAAAVFIVRKRRR